MATGRGRSRAWLVGLAWALELRPAASRPGPDGRPGVPDAGRCRSAGHGEALAKVLPASFDP